jgi:hypothetical protein
MVDTAGKQMTVSKDPVERVDQNGRQRSDRETGRLMWSTQVIVLDADGGEVITIHTAGEKPNVKVGELVTVSDLEALPWATNGRNTATALMARHGRGVCSGFGGLATGGGGASMTSVRWCVRRGAAG